MGGGPGAAVADGTWLRREHAECGHTTADIAAELVVADDTIRDALLRHRIPRVDAAVWQVEGNRAGRHNWATRSGWPPGIGRAG
jgi:hypothetical protein